MRRKKQQIFNPVYVNVLEKSDHGLCIYFADKNSTSLLVKLEDELTLELLIKSLLKGYYDLTTIKKSITKSNIGEN